MKLTHGFAAALVGLSLVGPLVLAQGPGPTMVVVAPLVEREIPASLRLVGTVLAEREALVAAEVSGPVLEYRATEGQFVKKGETIARIDPARATLILDEARGLLSAKEAALQQLTNGERPEEVRRLRASVAETKAMLEKWSFERDRLNELRKQNMGNDKEMHDTEMEYMAAERRLAQDQARLEMAENGARQEEIARARFEFESQKAAVKRLEHDLARAEIRAPFDGFVVRKRTEVGEWIVAGGPVCEMVATDVVKVRVDTPESAIGFARLGETATVEFEALGVRLTGPLSRVIPKASPNARTFPVEIDLANKEHKLLPGMFVWAHVPAGANTKKLMAPRDAIVARGTTKQVFVIRPEPPAPGGAPGGTRATPPGELAIPVDVATGLEIGEEIEISSAALKAGDRVVSRANERLYGPTPVVTQIAEVRAQKPEEKATAGEQ